MDSPLSKLYSKYLATSLFSACSFVEHKELWKIHWHLKVSLYKSLASFWQSTQRVKSKSNWLNIFTRPLFGPTIWLPFRKIYRRRVNVVTEFVDVAVDISKSVDTDCMLAFSARSRAAMKQEEHWLNSIVERKTFQIISY